MRLGERQTRWLDMRKLVKLFSCNVDSNNFPLHDCTVSSGGPLACFGRDSSRSDESTVVAANAMLTEFADTIIAYLDVLQVIAVRYCNCLPMRYVNY